MTGIGRLAIVFAVLLAMVSPSAAWMATIRTSAPLPGNSDQALADAFAEALHAALARAAPGRFTGRGP